DVKFVPVKTVGQQGILALHTARSLLVKQQTMLANAIRGLASEFGLVVPQGLHRLEELMVQVTAEASVPAVGRLVFITRGIFSPPRSIRPWSVFMRCRAT